jgi:hypothetical protein
MSRLCILSPNKNKITIETIDSISSLTQHGKPGWTLYSGGATYLNKSEKILIRNRRLVLQDANGNELFESKYDGVLGQYSMTSPDFHWVKFVFDYKKKRNLLAFVYRKISLTGGNNGIRIEIFESQNNIHLPSMPGMIDDKLHPLTSAFVPIVPASTAASTGDITLLQDDEGEGEDP